MSKYKNINPIIYLRFHFNVILSCLKNSIMNDSFHSYKQTVTIMHNLKIYWCLRDNEQLNFM